MNGKFTTIVMLLASAAWGQLQTGYIQVDTTALNPKTAVGSRNWHCTVMFAKLRDGGAIPLQVFRK